MRMESLSVTNVERMELNSTAARSKYARSKVIIEEKVRRHDMGGNRASLAKAD